MNKTIALGVLVASLTYSPSIVGATGKPVILQEDTQIDRTTAVLATEPGRRNFIPTPRQKPEIGDLALLNVSSVPVPKIRPVGIALPPHPLATGLLSKKDLNIYKQAIALASERKWKKARLMARRADYKLPAKIIDWRWMTAYRNRASFDQISNFIDANPDWPRQTTLQRRAEEALVDPVSADRTISWFSSREPLTGIGMLRYGEALIEKGQLVKGQNLVRRAWRVGNFPKDLERATLKNFNLLLTVQDHDSRLEHLLWERKATAATRMLPYASKGKSKLAVARIQLMTKRGNVDHAVRSVPRELQADPGLIFERAKWRRQKSLHEESQELLLQMDATVPRAEKWWRERHLQARKLLAKGHITDAYKLVSQHGLAQGGDFATAEWLSGWISLQFLGDPAIARQHFVRMYENVGYPISRARAAYWIGRADTSARENALAQYWYEVAAQHYTTYYGQMAHFELGKSQLPMIPKLTGINPHVKKIYDADERTLIIRHLTELNKPKWTRYFLLEMAETAKTADAFKYLAKLANDIGRPDYAISVAKRASQRGTELTEINWPTNGAQADKTPIEKALVFAIMRQESAFASDAISSAGARGLMQLMPATAKHVSRSLKVTYSKFQLTEDPDYNALLGSSYLSGLVDEFNGSYVLAIASYNAGPRNVRKWIDTWGDPRTGEIDMIDWIEFIPFTETRNYVQRVIENLQIYRQRLAVSQNEKLTIYQDLNRGLATH
ncbi:lytic transglycosylase domain-containing protein [Sneathiella marina]|uniref:Lytic transglycosylase domain-containing protein n=1 Tax=Sneathiella marina TaxID=2950108 RepID=A0ABY4VYB3_9PROT|nr:lytic transglycosylase domain-containing protein [Sneathiella marina]USG59823.1 lytic transglycosylase domain-containing protein [Sneathiella marina]